MDHPIVIEAILGSEADAALADRLHHLRHHGLIETLFIAPADLPRRRFHSQTDRGTPCFIALHRSQQLFDGAVVHLDAERAIRLRVGQQAWLRLRPSESGALELGYLAGNLHWRVRFDDDCLLVALDAPMADYLARLKELQQAGKVLVLD